MKSFLWIVLSFIAIAMLAANRTSIQIKPGDSYLVNEFPRWADSPRFVIDTRETER